MLVLSRRVGEKIIIGDGANKIVVVLTEIVPGTGKVRLGIEAPEDVDIVRAEIADEWKDRRRKK